MIQLHKFHPQWGLFDPSPFCMKAAILLQLAGQEYQTVAERDPGGAPRQKLPFITDGDQTIPDTTLIRKHLEQTYDTDFNAALDDASRAQSLFLIKTIDEYGYWMNVRQRWGSDENWAELSQALFGKIPRPMQGVIANKGRKTAQANLHGQGIGRFTDPEFAALAQELLLAIEHQLAGHDYAFADQPTAADASLYPFLISAAIPPIISPLKDAILESDRLKAYCNAMSAQFFPDHPKI